ncbi:hypothetical protein MMC07_006718 [Pseudocyphellaria aurata]|nr:hypothetical protein [Pseudocyphellaria aurata]
MCWRKTAKEHQDENERMTMRGRVVVEAVVGDMVQGSGALNIECSSSEGIADMVSGFARGFDGIDTIVEGVVVVVVVGNAGHEARVGTSSDSPGKAEGDAEIAQEEDIPVGVVHYEVEWLAAHEVALEGGRSSHLKKPRRAPSTRPAAATAGIL